MPPISFSDDFGFDFAVRCVLSGIGYDMADPGEVLATAEQVAAGDHDGWFDAWTALGERTEQIAANAAAGGHRLSAARAHLRAANYRYAGFYYVLATSDPGRHLAAWRDHRATLDAALALWDPRVERFDIPWEGGSLPGWCFRPRHAAARSAPVVVVHNGLASPLSDVLMTGVADAVDRGWAAVAFDGPGQGATWFEQGIGPVDDWERVGAAVLDTALGLGDLDPARVAVMGVADGGYLAARCARHDRRIGALVCDPGVLRPLDGALGQLPEPLQAAWRSGPRVAFDRTVAEAAAADPEVAFGVEKLIEQWPAGSLGEVFDRLSRWDLSEEAGHIDCPTFVADPDQAMSFPGQSAELARALGDRATLVRFTAAEGAGLDCEIGAPRLRNQRVFDWLDEQFPDDEEDG